MSLSLRRIYALEDLPPEVKAVTFAKTSRSPEPFDQIARELTEDSSAKFHEKWVVGYGHSSVAEHAVLSIAMENVSILASKVIEDNRLASFTEKSTRYQVFEPIQTEVGQKISKLDLWGKTQPSTKQMFDIVEVKKYYKPQAIMKSKWANTYEQTGDLLNSTYLKLVPRMIEFLKKKFPKATPISLRSRALDNIRYLLPTATLTNIGMTINARQLEYTISKMLSHPVDEIKEIGQEIKEVAINITPTLIKYAEPNKYLVETPPVLEKLAKRTLVNLANSPSEDVNLVVFDANAEDKLVAALLFKFSHRPYNQVFETVKKMTPAEKAEVIDEALKRRGEYDRPLRELEHIYYTFDLLVDFGAFRDIQRHRMVTQSVQYLNCDYGYSVPDEVQEAGFSKVFKECLEKVGETYRTLVPHFPYEASYIVANAYKIRMLFTWNLRELHHFISLRSGPRGHTSYRHISQKVYRILAKTHPLLAKYINVNLQKDIPPR